MTEETFGFGGVPTLAVPTEVDSQVDEGYDFPVDEGGGQYRPSLTPGTVHFRFESTELVEGKTAKDRETGETITFDEITYTAHVQTAELASGRILKDNGESEIPIRFNRASGFRTKKMREAAPPIQSGLQRLYQCLGLIESVGKPRSDAALVQTLRASSGEFGTGKLVWTCAKKINDSLTEVFSTSPNLKRGEKQLPRGEDGNPVQEVTFSVPGIGLGGEPIVNKITKTVREEVGRLFVPRVKKD